MRSGAGETRSPAQRIDAGGRLPGGRAFRGPKGSSRHSRSRRDAFTRCLAEKMLTFALGRGVEQADSPAVDQIVRRLARNGYRFSALVLGIVESEPFYVDNPSGR